MLKHERSSKEEVAEEYEPNPTCIGWNLGLRIRTISSELIVSHARQSLTINASRSAARSFKHFMKAVSYITLGRQFEAQKTSCRLLRPFYYV